MKSSSLHAQDFDSAGKESPTKPSEHQNGINVAFLGNSILYFNDTPRFLFNLSGNKIRHQDSCLRGGTTLTELYTLGNGMKRHGFATDNALMDNGEYDVGSPTVQELLQSNNKWDVVVMNEHSQGPARQSTREEFQSTLLQQYAPLISTNNPKATVIFVETAAYRLQGINNSHDLGTKTQFQQSIREGIQSYIQVLHDNTSIIPARMAPVGTAFLHVHNDNLQLWEKLFDPWDNFHPSPTGTFLQGCVLHCTIFGAPPPTCPGTKEEIAALWKDARMMHPKKKGEDGVALPNVSEVEYLW
eukprot:CAMPEP_0201714742 /NCGR_PEP_ID=MMETSP0593-20130828/1088_1 /ASSEMBLY_ACC=CAM_ASM_000672 /TAXON_ID=267983 /ORGANISM="Skeletonema japonicum, Strain CCMP2506" /LENGTH=299 /DNA_ID=CAMNT_0048204045 /DNA_START=327 /DNA_END=1223 /DNA_ORIENTATION=-